MDTVPVSVIIPCYQSYDSIDCAVRSVMLQTKLPKEIILIDDCSPDGGITLDKLYNIKERYQKKLEIIVLSLPFNQGAGSARNAGWNMASQEYIAFLDSDDVWHARKLEIQYSWMRAHPDVILTGHGYEKINSIDNLNNKTVKLTCEFCVNKYKLLFKNYYSTPSVMIKRQMKFRFQENKRYSEDYLLWLEISFYGKIYYLDICLHGIFKEEYGESGLSAQLWNMEKGELMNYNTLYKKKIISFPLMMTASVISVAKFFMRIIKINVKLKRGK